MESDIPDKTPTDGKSGPVKTHRPAPEHPALRVGAVSTMSVDSRSCCAFTDQILFLSPHSHIPSRMGMSDFPLSVKLYSTFGGI